MDNLAGRVAVVTGGARGVGLGLARAFAEQDSASSSRTSTRPALRDAVATLRASGEVISVPADVSDASAVARLRDQAFERFGTVDVLCSNAAAVDPVDLGRLVVRAIRTRARYVNTHRETLKWLQERADRMFSDADKTGTLR